jgi:hypothetical protein
MAPSRPKKLTGGTSIVNMLHKVLSAMRFGNELLFYYQAVGYWGK